MVDQTGGFEAGERDIRIVIDTNTLMAGLIAPEKASGKVLELWLGGDVEVFLSPQIRGEYLDILGKMRFGRPEAVAMRERRAEALLSRSIEVFPQRQVRLVKDDPADDKFLDCALEAQADCIITQDHHLLEVGEVEGIPVLTPGAFLQSLNDSTEH